MNHSEIPPIKRQMSAQPTNQFRSPWVRLFQRIQRLLMINWTQIQLIRDIRLPEGFNDGPHIHLVHGGHRLTQDLGMKLWSQLKHSSAGQEIHDRKDPTQNRFISTNMMNHRSLETLLIQGLIHKLLIQKPLLFSLRTLNAEDPWLLINKLVAIQPSIEASSQSRRLHLIRNRILKFRLQVRQEISSNLLIGSEFSFKG